MFYRGQNLIQQAFTYTRIVRTTRSLPTASWSSRRVSVRTSTMLVSAANLAHWLVNCRPRGHICSITRQVLAAPPPGVGSRSDVRRYVPTTPLFSPSFLHLLLSFVSRRLVLVLFLQYVIWPDIILACFPCSPFVLLFSTFLLLT